jgi:hypothetical protein
MHFQDALLQIAEMRERMAQSLTFRGYRSGTTAVTGGLALCGAAAQATWSAPSAFRVDVYLGIWLAVACSSLFLVLVGFALRQGEAGPMEGSLTLAAIECFLPSLVSGVAVTYALSYHQFTIDRFALLPGLWMLLFSLGLFASRRILPRSVAVAAAFYLLAGLFVLTLDVGTALSPWTMGGIFGSGQLLAAGILYWTLERPSRAEVCVE